MQRLREEDRSLDVHFDAGRTPLQAEICSVCLTRTTVRPLLSAMLLRIVPSDTQAARVFETSEVLRENCIHKF